MPINGLSFVIDNNGITLQGSLAGSNRPDISPLLNNLPVDSRLIVHSKPIYRTGQINSITNPNLVLPLSFGDNKYILFIKGEPFFPGYDFIPQSGSSNNIAKWISPQAIQESDEVVSWGPGNSYTAQAMVIENIDLSKPGIFTPGASPRIKLLGEGGLETLPYDLNSIYFCIAGDNRKMYRPGTDYSYLPITSELVWNKQVDIPIDSSTKCFAFYFNNKTTSPFKLGQILSRLIIEVNEDNQSSFEIAALPKTSLNTGSNLFYENKRYSYTSDYNIQYPNVFIQNSGNLKADIEEDKFVDLSYFKDGSAYSPIILVTQELSAGLTTEPGTDDKVYLTPLNPINQVVPSNKKVMVFFRGAFACGNVFDNGNVTSLYPGTEPEYTRDNTYIKWDTDRNGVVNVVPISGDWIDVVAFTDSLSQNHLNIEYFKRTSAGPDTLTLQKEVKQGKGILMYNGEPFFYGDFTINGTDKKIIENLPYSRPSGARFDDIAFSYVRDDAYANLFYFDKVITLVPYNSNTPIVLSYPVSNKNNTLLFVGPRRVRFDDYQISGQNSNQLQLSFAVPANERIMLIHT